MQYPLLPPTGRGPLDFSRIEYGLRGHGSYPYRPAAPRSLQFSPGLSRSVLTWSAPADVRGVFRYRVYMGSETNLVADIGVGAQRQLEVHLPVTTPTALYVSAVSAIARESPRVQLIVQVPGGAPNEPSLPKEWPLQPRGGRRYKTPVYER